MTKYEVLFKNCDSDIRQGRSQHVSRRLMGLNCARVPREWRLPLATVCRRAGLYNLGMRLLTQVVHPGRQTSAAKATQAEIAEYAVLLLRIDAVTEAVQNLQTIDTERVPEALLYRAFSHFARWECAEAIPVLQQYIQKPIEPYAKFVGQVNLAYALVESRNQEEAFPLLADTIRLATENRYLKLLSVCRVYRSRLYVQQRDFVKAKQELEAASRALESGGILDHQLVDKWTLIVEALETGTETPLDRLRDLSRKSNAWEDLREADLFSLKLKFDLPKFLHLVFGTRFPKYRHRICDEVLSLPDRQFYVLGPKDSPRMDIMSGKIDGRQALNPGRKCHQLLEILLRDFYQPQRIGGLFLELFPGEYFDVASSPSRVHQVIRRTRRWLESNQIPVQIIESAGFYLARIVGNFSFLIPLERNSVDAMAIHFDKLKALYPFGKEFTAKQARETLRVSKHTFQRIANWGLERGAVERIGFHLETVYKIKSEEPMSTKAAA